jgi:hypothetical protein
MTRATIIQVRVQRPQPLPQPVNLPSLKTLAGQAVAGSVFSHFVVFLIPCLLSQVDFGFWLIALPFFLFASLFGGVPAGFIIWACTRSDARPLHWAYRCGIALLVLLPGWLYLSSIMFGAVASVQLWFLAWLLVPALVIGLLTHSGLRVGRELARGGEAVGGTSRVLAALSGVVLRVLVVLSFMESFLATICLARAPNFQQELILTTLLCGHFAAGTIVLFVRTDLELLAIIASIALAPLIIAFVTFPQLTEILRYVFAGYIGWWVMFVFTRSRQLDRVLSFLNEEIHYYLMD